MATLKEIRKAIRARLQAESERAAASLAAWLANQENQKAELRCRDAGDALGQLLGSSKVTYRGKLYSVRDGKLCIENIRQIKN